VEIAEGGGYGRCDWTQKVCFFLHPLDWSLFRKDNKSRFTQDAAFQFKSYP
jgi:hypothetical protein